MRHTTHFILVLLIALLSPLATYASDFVVDGIYYNITSAENLTVEVTINPSKYQGRVVIPQSVTHDGTIYSVTTIADNAFKATALEAVDIPSTIVEIGNNAFDGCSKLQGITIPENVVKVGDLAFANCSGLKSFVFNAKKCEYFGKYDLSAFGGSNIEELTIGSEVQSIPRWAFWDCSGLKEIEMPESLTEIGDAAFHGCSGLETIIIPNRITSLSYMTFSGCTGLKSITLPGCIQYIHEKVFEGCTALSSVYCYAKKVPFVNNPFENCTLGDVVLQVPSSSLNDYQTASIWRDFGSISTLPEYLVMGDMDGDGILSMTDVNILTELVLDNSNQQVTSGSKAFFVGDMNGDKNLNIGDICYLIATICGRIPQCVLDLSAQASICYYGFTEFWKDDGLLRKDSDEVILETLAENRIPDNRVTVEIDGETTYKISGAEWWNNNHKKCRCWWTAIPTTCTITNAIESGFNVTGGFWQKRVQMRDVYGGTDSSPYIVNIGGVDYYVYAAVGSNSLIAYENANEYIQITVEK